MVATLGDDVPALSNGGQLNSRAVGWALKMTEDPDVLPQPPPKKTPTVFTTMVMDDRRLSVNQVVNAVGISRERVENILHNELGMSKVSTRVGATAFDAWSPVLFDQKHTTPGWSCRRRTWHFLKQIQSVFLNVSSPKMSVGSTTSSQRPNDNPCSGNTPFLPPPKKDKVVWLVSAGKVMASVFWDVKGIVFIDYLKKKPNYEWGILCQLAEAAAKGNQVKRPGKLTKGDLFHQDNAPAQKYVVAMAAVRDCDSQVVDHPPYSPDLAPFDYFLFPNWEEQKTHFAGKQYRTDHEVISAVEDFLRRMRASIPRESKRSNTYGRSVCPTGETMLKNEPYMVKFDHCIIVSLWTFPPTLVFDCKIINWILTLTFLVG